jgi:hypothetical protein
MSIFLLQPCVCWSCCPEDVPVGDDAIFGPDGRQVKLAYLPPHDLTDWQPHHKAMVVAAVRRGSITIDEARTRYNLSTERYLCWHRRYAATTRRWLMI